MANIITKSSVHFNNDYVTVDDIKLIISKYKNFNEDTTIDNYYVYNASDTMLGFLAEYLKLKVHLTNRKVLQFFIKAISRTNLAKAEMVKEMKLFDNEKVFYLTTKKIIETPGIAPWSPRLITALSDAMVFEDLNAIQYKLRDKFARFDMAHTLQALKALARFHASTIIIEEKKKKETNKVYTIKDAYPHVLDKVGYHISCDWYIQCMIGALEAMKSFSKYDETEIKVIEKHWGDIWSTALSINDFSPGRCHVICHRDLWNNNIMFHYKTEDVNELMPDDCLFVDFQAARYQPPASDVMLLICCNLDPTFRKKHLEIFLNFYYEELKNILHIYNIAIENIMTKDEFLTSALEQTKWGLVLCACLMPQFWIEENLTTTIFSDYQRFNEILCKNKGLFIKTMMDNNIDYRQKVMEIFEEIADRYCFDSIK